jgi:hypothetical protein
MSGIEYLATGTLEASSPEQQQLFRYLESNRIGFREFIRAACTAGASHEKSKGGSGHTVLRFGNRDAAITSQDRKVSGKWKPRDVISRISRLGIPPDVFLAALQGTPVNQEQEEVAQDEARQDEGVPS